MEDFEIENGVLKKYNGKARTVGIPDGVTEIGEAAFYCCNFLKSVTVSHSVAKIDDEAFAGCDSLATINIPVSVTEIGEDALAGCKSLSEFGYNGTKAQWEAVKKGEDWHKGVFTKCVCCSDGMVELPQFNIKDGVLHRYLGADPVVAVPDGVTEIGSSAFNSCDKLVSVSIPESITYIGIWAFAGCSSLVSVSIQSNLTRIGAGAVEIYGSLAAVNIPANVTGIEFGAFASCTALASIVLPATLTYIDSFAFSDCPSLKEIRFDGTIEQWKAVEKCWSWLTGAPVTAVICTDGELSL